VLLWTIAGAVLVGFSEELAFRGLVLTSLRGPLSEQGAWLWSTVMFGLLHAPNVLIGGPVVGVVMQPILAAITGTSLYLTRRVTGSIIPAMVLHGLWDFSSFTARDGYFGTYLLLPTSITIFIIFWFQRRHVFADAETATPHLRPA